MKKHWQLLTIIVVSLAVHFAFFGYPKQTVFDEVHFGKFINGYFSHEYFFDIHPPLAKLILSGMGYITNFQPTFSFANIGNEFPDDAYLWLRFLPSLMGAFLPVIIWFLALELGFKKHTALLIALLVALDNALLVQSRFILLDAFLLVFGFSSLWLYAIFRRNQQFGYLAAACALAALALSVKWTGATFLFIIIVLEILKSWRHWRPYWLVSRFLVLLALPFLLYYSAFSIHFTLLNKSGPGDGFMTPEFRKTLTGSTDYARSEIKPLSDFGKFLELNKEMYRSNARLTAGHPYSSTWETWPFMVRPIYYWNNDNMLHNNRIYLIGNPIIWWLSTLGIIYAILTLIAEAPDFVRKGLDQKQKVLLFILGGYLLNLLPFIGIQRAMFLYHYFNAFIFAILALGLLIESLDRNYARRLIIGITCLATVSFLFFAPLSYGLSLTDKAFNYRIWFKTWR